jgi:hypothetical protein
MSFQYIQQQHLAFSQEYCLFHTTTNQSIVCSVVIQPLALHLTVLLGIVSWFRIMYGDNLPPSANTANVTVTWLFMFFWCFYHHLRFTYGDNLLPSASTVNVAVTCRFMLPDVLITTSFVLTLLTVLNEVILKHTGFLLAFLIWCTL